MKPLRIGIAGATTLKGKEIKAALEESSLPALDIVLLDDDAAIGKLEAVGDEATFVQSITQEALARLEAVFFTGDAEFTRQHYMDAKRANCSIVDLSFALENQPGFPVRAPWLEEELGYKPALDNSGAVTAHPAAIVLALLLQKMGKLSRVRTAAATVLQPVSESGHAGMDELHQQTINVLNFQSLPRAIFSTQIAFNLVRAYGGGSTAPLDEVRDRILSHFGKIAPGVFVPAVNLVAAPVFHGHTLSLYVELESDASLESLASALVGPHTQIVSDEADANELPGNVAVAGEDKILLTVEPASPRANAFWIWVAADNLKVIALNAIECARRLAEMRPAGKVQ